MLLIPDYVERGLAFIPDNYGFPMSRYRLGIRGYAKFTVKELLRQYLRVEQQFQLGHYDKCVEKLRQKEENIELIVSHILSRSQVQAKNKLILMIIVSLTSSPWR